MNPLHATAYADLHASILAAMAGDREDVIAVGNGEVTRMPLSWAISRVIDRTPCIKSLQETLRYSGEVYVLKLREALAVEYATKYAGDLAEAASKEAR